MHGTVLAVVPTDEALPVRLVVSDFESGVAEKASQAAELHQYRLWVDLSDSVQMSEQLPAGTEVRPEQWDETELAVVTGEALSAAGLTGGRVGTDLNFVSQQTYVRLQGAAPNVTWIDSTSDLYEVRLVKEAWEVERLQKGVELSEAGMLHAAHNLHTGMTAREVRLAYQAGVTAHAADERYVGYTENWVLPTVGGATSASYGATRGGLEIGGLVKFDCGATVDGYRSDGGRTFSHGPASEAAIRLYGVLSEAQRIARETIRPGTPISEVFKSAMNHVHTNGYPGYNRGHIGHSIGIDSFHEEPPYLSPGCHRLIEPGMVFAVELPSYTPDIGAIMIEDLVHVQEDATRTLHTLPHELQAM